MRRAFGFLTFLWGTASWGLTPYMLLNKPTANDTQYRQKFDVILNQIDEHDHSIGKGKQIPTGGLADQAVTSSKIANATISLSDMGVGSVSGAVIADGAITSRAKFTNGAFTTPTIVEYTSGSGTYTPSSASVVYIRVKLCGGGGGGFGANGTASSGGTGGTTTFGPLTATGGIGASGVIIPGTGGTATINSPAYGLGLTGADGNGGQQNSTGTIAVAGGSGGASPFGGAGRSSANAVGGTAKANSCSGGGGAGGTPGNDSGAGGGAGAFIDAFIPSPTSYSYSVGAVGAAGGGTTAGGAGAAGRILIEEHYQ